MGSQTNLTFSTLFLFVLGRRGDEESNDDDVETQSVASYSSTPGTHSGDEGASWLSSQHVIILSHASWFGFFSIHWGLFNSVYFSLADVIDEGVDVDFEDGFEQALAENIDSATQKR